jgi:hypothetical protein
VRGSARLDGILLDAGLCGIAAQPEQKQHAKTVNNRT